ncbi:MAG: SH3 domain-containing protein [Clostridium sp.]
MRRKKIDVLIKGAVGVSLAASLIVGGTSIKSEASEITNIGVKNISITTGSVRNTSRNIVGQPTANVKEMQEWARSKGATETFISLAQKYVDLAGSHGGINPVMAYVQSAVETGYGKFGGVLNESYNNPCGLKTKDGGSNTDPNAHQRFESWEDGIRAHLDHLALYAGVNGYPRADTKDPRHFPSIFGKAKTIAALSGTWATDTEYGNKISRLMSEIEKSGGGNEEVNPPVKPEEPTPPAESGKTGTITASALNVRSGAGTGYGVIGSLKNGAKVTVIETKNGWHKIKYGNGYGYVSSDYVKFTSGETTNPGPTNPDTTNPETGSKTGTVTASGLNVRNGAGTGNRVIGSLGNGAKVTIVETKNGWHKIKYGNGYGYVSSDYVKVNGGSTSGGGSSSSSTTKTVTASALNVRSGAGTGYRVVGSLRNGAKVTVVETKNGWHKIKYGNGYGYVSAEYVR